ncbi:hypothetical protein F5Y08DRAFT_208117 [Xylaria arbuscula]|nr:hypothetical protein F5Y08DRAFT_208117 [Xylaria arbuscula]
MGLAGRLRAALHIGLLALSPMCPTQFPHIIVGSSGLPAGCLSIAYCLLVSISSIGGHWILGHPGFCVHICPRDVDLFWVEGGFLPSPSFYFFRYDIFPSLSFRYHGFLGDGRLGMRKRLMIYDMIPHTTYPD